MDWKEKMTFGDPVLDSQATTPTKRRAMAKMQREPARWVSLIGALIALAMAFGLELTTEQVGAITSVVVLLIGEVTRGKVKPTDVDE